MYSRVLAKKPSLFFGSKCTKRGIQSLTGFKVARGAVGKVMMLAGGLAAASFVAQST